MGGFWSNIYHRFFPLKPVKVFIRGLDAAGKTTLLYSLKIGVQNSQNMIPTIGFNVQAIDLKNNIKIEAWDVGGGSQIKKLIPHYYEDMEVIVWIVDCTDIGRIQELAKDVEDSLNHEKLKDSIILVLSNKQDLASNSQKYMTNDFLVNKLNLNKLTEQKRIWNIMKCSCKTGEGLKEAMEWLSLKLYHKKKQQQNVQQ